MKKQLVLMFVFLLLLPVVSAQAPPFQTTAETGQLIISVPKIEFMTQGANFNFYVHAYNSTGHLVTNTSADCYLHIFNNTGDHIIDGTMSFDSISFDFYYEINNTVTANKGLLAFISWCNTTNEGGFASGNLMINDATSVDVTEDSTQGLSLCLFVLFSTIIVFLLPKLYGTFTKNQITNIIITRCCYVIGFYLMVMNAGLFSSIAISAGYATGEVFRYMWLFGIGGYLMMFITGVKTIFDIVELYKKLVNERRGIE